MRETVFPVSSLFMLSQPRLVASIAPLVFTVSVSLGGIVRAASEDIGPVRIEVFTAHDIPIESVRRDDSPSTIEVYEIDGIKRVEAELSAQLPNAPDAAKRAAQERVSQSDSSKIDQVARTALGLVKAAKYGIDRYPAIVFDGEAVVYGVTDIGEALRLYRERQGTVLR